MLTNTIGQRNRNTLAINSKRTPSERNNELQESRREQVHWSREESTSCREVELYETSQTDGAQGCQSFQRPRPLHTQALIGTGREVSPAFRLDATGHAWPRGRRRASARKTAPSKGDVDSTAGAMEYGREPPQKTVPRRCAQRPARSRLDKAPKRRAQLAPPTAALPNPADDPSLECAAEERGAGQWPGAVTSPLP